MSTFNLAERGVRHDATAHLSLLPGRRCIGARGSRVPRPAAALVPALVPALAPARPSALAAAAAALAQALPRRPRPPASLLLT